MTEKTFNPVDKGIKSIKWTALSSIIPQVLKPFLTIWLATLIDPSAYGLVAIAAVVIGFNRLVQGLGFSEYLISSKESDDVATNTAFWSNIILGLLMYILLVLLTPLIVHFYKIDDLTYILPVLGLMIIINSSGIYINYLKVKYRIQYYLQSKLKIVMYYLKKLKNKVLTSSGGGVHKN